MEFAGRRVPQASHPVARTGTEARANFAHAVRNEPPSQDHRPSLSTSGCSTAAHFWHMETPSVASGTMV